MPTSPRVARIAPAIAAGLALLAIPTVWAVADTTSTTSATGEKVIRPNWTITDVRVDDIAPAGDSSGDTYQFTKKFTGKIGGTADYACTVVGTHYLCDGILRFSDGDIYVATGPVDDTLPAAITGGTRAYQGVRGQFVKTAKPDGTGTYTLTFRK